MTNKFDRIHTNTNKKYVIRNCPCVKHSDEIELDNRCMSTQDDKLFFCENNIDCVMKQIVELCEDEVELVKKCQEETKYPFKPTAFELAEKILNQLDIQEVE